MGEAKVWSDRKAGEVGGDWIKLKDEFCLFFCDQGARTLSSTADIPPWLQVTWSNVGIFPQMATSRSPHGIPEEALMQHFVGKLKLESANSASEDAGERVFYGSHLQGISHDQSLTVRPSQLIYPLEGSKFAP